MISACLECARSGICFELQLCLWNANIREPIRLPKSLHMIRVRIENATFAISSPFYIIISFPFPSLLLEYINFLLSCPTLFNAC